MSKIIRFAKFVKDIKKTRDFPRVVNYDITSRCNLKCEHCYWHKTNEAHEDLPDEIWLKTFKDHVKRGANAAYLTGGEPTLKPKLIEAADKIFPEMAIVSNGINQISKSIQRRIMISIDGPKEIHNKIRGLDIFDKVVGNIKNDKRVILTPTLSTTNYKYIEDLVRIARESGVDGITFSTYTSHQGIDDPYYLSGEKLDWTIKELLRVYRENKDIVFMTPKIIKSWRDKNYYRKCYFKSSGFVAYDANLKIKKPCTLGAKVKCETCGCIVPVFASALKKMDLKSWFLLDKFFPSEYSKNF